MVWHQVHVNFGGCCISGISGTLVTMDVDITPPDLLQQTYHDLEGHIEDVVLDLGCMS
jgi:hypothetical protein